LEDLTSEVEALRAENKRLNEETTNKDIKVEESYFSLRKCESELQETKAKAKELEMKNEQLQNEKLSFDTNNVNSNVKIAKLEDEIKKLERKLRLAQTQPDTKVVSSPAVVPSSNTYVNANLIEPPKPSPAKVEISIKEAPVVKNIPPKESNANVSAKAHVEDDFFGDLPSEPIVPKEKEPKNTANVNKETESKEWEEVSVEYESEVEEPFGKEFEKDEWYLGVEDKEKYKDMFVQADLNKDGFVDGNEATRFFWQIQIRSTIIGANLDCGGYR